MDALRRLRQWRDRRKARAARSWDRVFCIGFNKTGTTSIQSLFEQLGLHVAPQPPAEALLEDWARGDYRRIIRFCRRYDAFQDIPFSLPGTWRTLDRAFPDSKFVLTVRRDADEWYDSMVRFESQLFGKRELPTADEMKAFPYRYRGWFWQTHQLGFGVDESTLYDPALYRSIYLKHIDDVREYFEERTADLLMLNVADTAAARDLSEFLGFGDRGIVMPRLNPSR